MIKALALSKLTYYLINLPRPPDNFLEKITRAWFNFIWNGKRDEIKRKVMVKRIEDGGVGMIDLNSFGKALKLTWMKRILHSQIMWKYLGPKHIDIQTVIETGGYINTGLVMRITNLFGKELYQNWNESLCETVMPTEIDEIVTVHVQQSTFL